MSTKVRFTGNRTGLASYVIPRVGLVTQGDEFEVDDAAAERYCTPHATVDGGMASDFELVEPKADEAPPANEATETPTETSPVSDTPPDEAKPRTRRRHSEDPKTEIDSSADSAEGGQ